MRSAGEQLDGVDHPGERGVVEVDVPGQRRVPGQGDELERVLVLGQEGEDRHQGVADRSRRPQVRLADRSYQAALECFERLALRFPKIPAYRARAAECRFRLGIVAERDGRIQQAEQDFRQGIRLAEEVAKELPNDGDLRMQLGFSYRWLAQFLGGAGSPEEVEKLLVRSFTVLDKLVAEFPNADGYLAELSFTCRDLAEQHFRTGRTDEARRLYERVIGLSEQILATTPVGQATHPGCITVPCSSSGVRTAPPGLRGLPSS